MRPIGSVAIIGAGNMGSGIAQKSAQEQFDVQMVDREEQWVERGQSIIASFLDEAIERRIFREAEAEKIKARIIAKQNGVIAGIEFCKKAFKLIGKESIFKSKIKDGKFIKKNKVIAEILANTKTILTAERTALNFLNHASGIATTTNNFVKKVGKKTKICCTRKTTPNLRLLEKYAVKQGGGFNHRYNLSDEILIKDNHIKAAKDLNKLVYKASKSKKVVTVEIENVSPVSYTHLTLPTKRIV